LDYALDPTKIKSGKTKKNVLADDWLLIFSIPSWNSMTLVIDVEISKTYDS
jgi:hypothetical protein